MLKDGMTRSIPVLKLKAILSNAYSYRSSAPRMVLLCLCRPVDSVLSTSSASSEQQLSVRDSSMLIGQFLVFQFRQRGSETYFRQWSDGQM